MKKLAAFLTASAVTLLVIAVFLATLSPNLNTNNRKFNYWYSSFKDNSYNAISQNLHKSTMPVFGSSEIGHGAKLSYGPQRLLERTNTDIMTIGCAYNQCLNHSIVLGSVGRQLKGKKVVLILSPSWFYRGGLSGARYEMRFSETEYSAFMRNPDLPADVKEYVARRSRHLLKKNDTLRRHAALYNRINGVGGKKATGFDRISYRILNAYTTDRDYLTMRILMKKKGIRFLDQYQGPADTLKHINWEKWKQKAVSASPAVNNPYYMAPKAWKKFSHIEEKARGLHRDSSYAVSPEYEDLECFLKVCKAEGIQPLLILQPVNGYWFDHTGLPEIRRDVLRYKIDNIASRYQAQVADLSNESYTKNFFEDAVHPYKLGWVTINEQIYKFYNKSN